MFLRTRSARWSVASATLLCAFVFAACSLDTEGKIQEQPGELGGSDQGGAGGEEIGGNGGASEQGGASGEGGWSAGGTSSGGSSSGGASGEGGTSSGGASGLGGSSTGGASGQGGSSGAGVEQDCLNSADDDADGKKDCEDTDCTTKGFGCVTLPSGWQGFFRIRTGAYAGAPAPLECPGDAPPSRRYLDPADAAQCSSCTCSWSGGSCSFPRLACSGANSTCYDAQISIDFDCTDCCTIDTSTWPQYPYFSCRVEPTSDVASPGTCSVAGGPSDFTNKDPWGRVLDICAVPSTASGCAAGSSCLSPDVGGYDPELCIRHDQDVACPTGWTKKAVSYASATDTRGCSSCGCGAPSGVKCTGGSYRAYDTDGCTACPSGSSCSSPASVANTCVDLGNHADNQQFSLIIDKAPSPSGGTCTATGGTATGQLTPAGAETWCCK